MKSRSGYSSLLARVRRSLEKTVSLEDAVAALSLLTAKCGDDETLDKWLYQTISGATKSGLACQFVLVLVDKLEARLRRRKDSTSLARVALGAGASVNGARLQLQRFIATPSTQGGEALLERGVRGVLEIGRLLQVMAMNLEDSISPRRYANSLRSTLIMGAHSMELKSPTLAQLAWACRRVAVEALIMTAAQEVDTVTSESLRGLSGHYKMAPRASSFRAEWFASLEHVIQPWRATLPIKSEWFLRHAAAFDALGDRCGAAAARSRGRLHTGRRWPLYSGIFYCSDLKSKNSSSHAFASALKCFDAALDDHQTGGHGKVLWQRAWMALANAPMSDAYGHSGVGSALPATGNIVARCPDTHVTNVHQADVHWQLALLAASQGEGTDMVRHCDFAEPLSCSARTAAGLKKVSLAVLRWTTSLRDMRITATALERAAIFAGSCLVAWMALAECLLCVGRYSDAAGAAAKACGCCLDAGSVHDAVTCYSCALIYMRERPPPLLPVLLRVKASLVGDALRERFFFCEARRDVSDLITAAEELAVYTVECCSLPAAPVMAQAGMALTFIGAYRSGSLLSRNGLNDAYCDLASAFVAWCSLANVASLWDVHNQHVISAEALEVSALSILTSLRKNIPRWPLDVEIIAGAAVALQDMFLAIGDSIGQSCIFSAVPLLVPQLQIAVMASSLAGHVALTPRSIVHFESSNFMIDQVNEDPPRHELLAHGVVAGGNGQTYALVAFDEAMALSHPRATAEIGLELYNACAKRGNSAEAIHIAMLLENLMRRARPYEQGILFADSVQSRKITRGVLWLHLAELWLRRGSSSHAGKYAGRRNIPEEGRLAIAIKVSMRTQSWYWTESYLQDRRDRAETRFSSNFTSLDEALDEGDVLRYQGNLAGAAVCYVQAMHILLVNRASNGGSPEAFCYRSILGRVTRVADLLNQHECHEIAYRFVLRTQPSSIMNRAWTRYRLGCCVFDHALTAKAAGPEAMNLLCHAFLAALQAHHWKLAEASARVLTVAALHFAPGAMSSPLVGLLAHASLGHARLTAGASGDFGGALSLCSTQVDLLTHLLCAHTSGGAWRPAESLDMLLAPLPETYPIVACFISPTGHLVMARVQRGRTPVTLCTLLPQDWHGTRGSGSILKTCHNVLATSSLTLRSSQQKTSDAAAARRNWWCRRHALESALKASLDALDKKCIGALRALLTTLPTSENNDEISEVMRLCVCAAPHLTRAEARALSCTRLSGVISVPRDAVNSETLATLHLWLSLVHTLRVTELKSALAELGLSVIGVKQQLFSRLSEALRHAAILPNYQATATYQREERHPLILALDRHIQSLPIEDLPVTRAGSISRVPSLAFALSLAAHMCFSSRKDANKKMRLRACYVIDPDANLPATRSRLNDGLNALDQGNIEWNNIPNIGWTSMPSCVAYLFCGHGHGAAFFSSVVKKNAMFAALLMGCSSGMLPQVGDLAAHGVVLELLTRGAPSILATLWDVTDRDMDWVTLKLLQLLAEAPAYSIPGLVRTAKNEAKLRMLNGSALVCYGLPVSLEDIHLARLAGRGRTPNKN